jgi:hypothetical protein
MAPLIIPTVAEVIELVAITPLQVQKYAFWAKTQKYQILL